MNREYEEILVVDDNEDIRALVVYLLEIEGYRVREAEDGEEAIAFLQDHPVDLIFLDVMMPGISGLEVLQRIRRGEVGESAKVPVIMLTAKTQVSDMQEAVASGASTYMLKPFQADEIRIKVEELLDHAV